VHYVQAARVTSNLQSVFVSQLSTNWSCSVTARICTYTDGPAVVGVAGSNHRSTADSSDITSDGVVRQQQSKGGTAAAGDCKHFQTAGDGSHGSPEEVRVGQRHGKSTVHSKCKECFQQAIG